MKDIGSIFYVLAHVQNRLRRLTVIVCGLILLLVSTTACGTRGGAHIYNRTDTIKSVPGLLDDSVGDNKSVYILYVHGMGKVEKSFADPLLEQAERRFSFEHHKRKVNLYSYYWDTEANILQKHYTEKDVDVKEPRAWINKTIKDKIVNYGFSDAALYLGTFGYVMRQGLESALCVMLSEAVKKERDEQTACHLSALANQDFTDVHIKFVAKSLGSRYLFDTLSPLDQIDSLQRLAIKHNVSLATNDELDFGPGKPEADAVIETIKTKQEVIQSITDAFFLANQLPLLGLGQIRADTKEVHKIRDSLYCRYVLKNEQCSTKLPGLVPAPFQLLVDGEVDGQANDDGQYSGLGFFAFVNAVRNKIEDKLNVVAFHDPNDLLGFKAGEHLTDEAKGSFNFIEIVHHNASVFCCLWAWPPDAHAKEDERPIAAQIIWCGGTVLESGQVKPKSCG